MNAKVNMKCHVSFSAWTAETSSTIKVLFILYFASDPELESKSESISSAKWESESEQPHHDSAPLLHSPDQNSLKIIQYPSLSCPRDSFRPKPGADTYK